MAKRYFDSYKNFLDFKNNNNIKKELNCDGKIYYEVEEKITNLINEKGILNISQPDYNSTIVLFKDMTYIKYSRNYGTVYEWYDGYYNEKHEEDNFVYYFVDIKLEDLEFLSLEDYNIIHKEFLEQKHKENENEEYINYLKLKKKFEKI